MNWLLVAHEALCFTLIVCVFFRSVQSTSEVLIGIRLSFQLLWTSACLGMAAPLVWGYDPHFVEVLMLAGYTSVQLTTSLHWGHGVPRQFLKPECRPKRRKADFSDSYNTAL